MKKIFGYCLAGASALAAMVSCKTAGPEKVTALVAGCGEPIALVVEYADTVDAASVNADCYTVEGKEIVAVMVTDVDPTAAPQMQAPQGPQGPQCPDMDPNAPKGPQCPDMDPNAPKGPQCPDMKGPDAVQGATCPMQAAPKNGKYVIIVLKSDKPAPQPCEGAPAPCDSAKPCGGPAPDQACGEAPEHPCEGAAPDSAACPDSMGCPKGDRPEMGPEGAPQPAGEIAVPEIGVQQVKDIKKADGKTAKAWKAAAKATAAAPAPMGRHHGPMGQPGQPCPGQPAPGQPGQPAPAPAPGQPGPAPRK